MKGSILALATIGLATASFGQVSKSGSGYLLRVKYTPGASYNYNLVSSFKSTAGSGPSQNMTMKLAQKCVSVAKGIATVNVTTSGVPGQAKPTTQQVKIDQQGKYISGQSGGGMNFANVYPTNAVKVGQTWKSQTPIPQLGGQKATVTYVFKGLKSVGGRQVAQLDYTVSLAGQFVMSGKGSSLLDSKDGQLVSSTLNASIAMTPPAQAGAGAKPMKFNLSVSMKRA